MTLVDFPDKKQKFPHYEHRIEKLDHKNEEFTIKKFQEVRNCSSPKKIIKSIKRIGMCVNNRSPLYIPTKDLNKVCFEIINDNGENKKGTGPLNDCFLTSHKFHHFGYKIFFLYNSRAEDFTRFLKFFLKNTSKELVVFYSGSDKSSEGIEFNKKIITKSDIHNILTENSNHKAKTLFITDCKYGGSIFDTNEFPNAISFSVKKGNTTSNSGEDSNTHGIFTYYFCRAINQDQAITTFKLTEKMNFYLSRFHEVLICEFSNKRFNESPILIQ